MLDAFLITQKLLAVVLVGYLLGAVPFAHLAGRLRGVDMFKTGSTRAGAANLFWNVGRRIGLVVLFADAAKGSLAIIIAGLMGISGPLLLLAGGAAVLGHWKSVFTRFRGGDGMAVLIGVSLTLMPLLAFTSGMVGLVAAFIAIKSAFRSAFGMAVSFSVMLGLSQLEYFQAARELVPALTILAVLIMAHNILIHWRHAGLVAGNDLGPGLDLDNLDLDESDFDDEEQDGPT